MERGDGRTSTTQRSLEICPSSCSRLHDNFGDSHSQGEIGDRDQVRQSTWNYSIFARSNLQGDCSRQSHCQRYLKDTPGSLGRAKPYTKIYLLTPLYTTKIEEGSLDVDGYVKSMEAIWRLKDINLKFSEEHVVLMGPSPSFGTQRRILESQKDLLI